ncbi:MAG: 16S rRNA (cytosine(1402)-N(4))-methyltransferase RsmH [Candidatus Methylomirabilales bacterium]
MGPIEADGPGGVTGSAGHVPVLVREVLDLLQPARGGIFLDCTVGAGGHAAAILDAGGEDVQVIGVDRDPEMLAVAASRLAAYGARARLVHDDFRSLLSDPPTAFPSTFDGILFDLGVSSIQLGDPARGFGFAHEGPLDMRMDRRGGGETAQDMIARLSEAALADLLWRFGEERFARQIARRVVAERLRRPIETTRQLAELVARTIPRRVWPRRIHPATRTFQGLRIAVNDELVGLEEVLERAAHRLAPEGRLCVIAFHSLEDRPVKQVLRRLTRQAGTPVTFRPLTKKPIRPSTMETHRNPRARSAKLRAIVRVAGGIGCAA